MPYYPNWYHSESIYLSCAQPNVALMHTIRLTLISKGSRSYRCHHSQPAQRPAWLTEDMLNFCRGCIECFL